MNKNRILIAFILIGILASVILSFNRITIESNKKSIDITLDLNEIKKLSEQSDEDLSWWFKKFKEWGVGSVTLNEETFESMAEEGKPIVVGMVENLIKDMYWKERYPQELVSYLEKDGMDKHDVIAITNSESLYNFIEEGLKNRYDEDKYKIFNSESEYIFLLDGTEKDALYARRTTLIDNNNKPYSAKMELSGSKLFRLGLGYDEEKIQTIKESGLEIILRPFDYNPSWTGERYVKTSLDEYRNFNIKPRYMFFAGEQVLGYPNNLDILVDFMKENNTIVGLIESGEQRGHIKQTGLDDLTRVLDYNAVRVFSMDPYIQERYKFYNYNGAEEIENTLYRAVTERNIGLIYFRPFKSDSYTYVTDEKEYEETFNSLRSRIAEHGMILGEASVMESNVVNPIFKILIGLGILGAGILLVESIFKINRKIKMLAIILGLIFGISFTLIAPFTSVKIFAILAAIVFPSLSMVYLCKTLKSYYFKDNIKGIINQSIMIGIKTLLIMVLISSIGALFVASLLSSTEYLLEMDIFKGVKVVQLAPIALYVIIFMAYFGYKQEKPNDNTKFDILDLKDVLLDNIKVIYLLIAILMAGAGYIYLARTGHETNIQPSSLEMIGRNMLEMKLLARPRTKEFLFAFPAILIAIYMGINRTKIGMFIVGFVVIIGQTSIVNTFSHLRTPIYLSLVRTIYGVAFGIVIGIIYVILLDIGVKLTKTLGGELFDE